MCVLITDDILFVVKVHQPVFGQLPSKQEYIQECAPKRVAYMDPPAPTASPFFRYSSKLFTSEIVHSLRRSSSSHFSSSSAMVEWKLWDWPRWKYKGAALRRATSWVIRTCLTGEPELPMLALMQAEALERTNQASRTCTSRAGAQAQCEALELLFPCHWHSLPLLEERHL